MSQVDSKSQGQLDEAFSSVQDQPDDISFTFTSLQAPSDNKNSRLTLRYA